MSAILEQINSIGSRFFEFAGPMLVQASLLILIILSLDFLLRRRVRAVFRYWLWMLVLVKLVLPTSLATPVSLGNWFSDEFHAAKQVLPPVPFDWVASQAQSPAPLSPPAIAPVIAPPLPVEAEPVAVERAYAPPPAEMVRLTAEGFLFLGWLTVALAMVVWLLRRTVFARAVVAQARDAEGWMNDALESCQRLMGVKRGVRLGISSKAASPAVCGLLRPTILIPEHLAPKLKGGELRAILLHELAHIQRGDLWVNLAQTVLQTLYFYNPFVWLANAMINRVREQAVDEAVLVALGAGARDEYLDTLVRVARTAFRQPVPSLRLLGVVESKNTLKERVKTMLNRPVPTTARLGLFGVLAIALTGTLLIPMARAAREGERERERDKAVETRREGASDEVRALQEQIRALQKQMERMQDQMMRMHDERRQLEQARRKAQDVEGLLKDRDRMAAEKVGQLQMKEEALRRAALDRERGERVSKDRAAERERKMAELTEQVQRLAESEREGSNDTYKRMLRDLQSAQQMEQLRRREPDNPRWEGLREPLPPRDVPPVPAMPPMPRMPAPNMIQEMIGESLPRMMQEMTPRMTQGVQELWAAQQQTAQLQAELERARGELRELREQDKSERDIARAEQRLKELEAQAEEAKARSDRQTAEFEQGMKEWGEQFGKRMEQWGKQFGEQYGKNMELYGREMERWGEDYGRRMEQWGEQFGRTMEGMGERREVNRQPGEREGVQQRPREGAERERGEAVQRESPEKRDRERPESVDRERREGGERERRERPDRPREGTPDRPPTESER